MTLFFPNLAMNLPIKGNQKRAPPTRIPLNIPTQVSPVPGPKIISIFYFYPGSYSYSNFFFKKRSLRTNPGSSSNLSKICVHK